MGGVFYLLVYTSGNTFSFLASKGWGERLNDPCEMSRKQFSQQKRTRYELPFVRSSFFSFSRDNASSTWSDRWSRLTGCIIHFRSRCRTTSFFAAVSVENVRRGEKLKSSVCHVYTEEYRVP